MERDAAGALPVPSDPTKIAEVVPPYEWPFVRKIAFVGCGMLAAAALIGLLATALDAGSTWPGHYPRLVLVLIGAITVGGALSMRPDLWQAWALGTVGCILAIFGTPAHWDSFRTLFGVMAAVGLAWTVFLYAPRQYRYVALSAILFFHFTGIFFATTTPPSTPWVTEQAYLRVYNPYLQFLYLRNAYHFYSPQPGPASVLVFFLKTEAETPHYTTGTAMNWDDLRDAKIVPEKARQLRESVRPEDAQKLEDILAGKTERYSEKWIVLPRRPADVKDPLGLTYYRYLAITEQVARATPALRANTFEAEEMRKRRRLVSVAIPLHPTDEPDIQYQLLQSDVARYVAPSYASHVILENTRDKDEAARTTVKMYRVQHNTMNVEEFINWRKRDNIISSPYHPTTYRPYFLGEFDALGNLVNPQEPLLYWLVPILPRQATTDQSKRNFIDYMSIHAIATPGLDYLTVDNPEWRSRVFDWNQLR